MSSDQTRDNCLWFFAFLPICIKLLGLGLTHFLVFLHHLRRSMICYAPTEAWVPLI
jgi:hypothetical protein